MSFPNIIYGNYGDEKIVSSTKVLELGQRMQLPNGSIYAYAQCSSTATLAVGLMTCGKELHFVDTALVATAATGSIAPVVTFGATAAAVTKDLYADGFLYTYKGTGGGMKYKVKSHGTAGAATALTVNLDPDDPITVTMTAATVMLRENPFKYVLLRAAASTSPNIFAGVPAASCAVSQYLWLQRRGETMLKISGTIGVAGDPVVISAATAGNGVRWLASADTASVGGNNVIGQFVSPVDTVADYALVYLTLD